MVRGALHRFTIILGCSIGGKYGRRYDNDSSRKGYSSTSTHAYSSTYQRSLHLPQKAWL